MGVPVLVQYADRAYGDSPDDYRKATQLIGLLARFSTRGTPLNPNLSVKSVALHV